MPHSAAGPLTRERAAVRHDRCTFDGFARGWPAGRRAVMMLRSVELGAHPADRLSRKLLTAQSRLVRRTWCSPPGSPSDRRPITL
jgi:hypothetical protein